MERLFLKNLSRRTEPCSMELIDTQLRVELDDMIAHILFTFPLVAEDVKSAAGIFPRETFRVLKEKEVRQFGEYRTRRLVLDAWDAFTTKKKE